MNYIIDPRWFYFINIIGHLQAFTIIVAICLIATGGIVLGVVYAESDFKSCPGETRLGKICMIVGVVLSIAAVFIPSKEMEIAKHVTYDSTETAVQMIQEATDYILEKTGGKESK